MAITHVLIYDVTPGRRDDFLSYIREGIFHVERHGGTARLFNAVLAGPNSSRVNLSVEGQDTMAGFGQVWDEFYADSEVQQFLQRWAADSPIDTPPDTAVYVDLLDQVGSGGRGEVIHTAIGRMKPGRLDDLLEISSYWMEAVLESGGLNARTVRAAIAGPNTGVIVSVGEYADYAAFGEAFDRRRRDEDFQRRVIQPMSGAEAPVTSIGQSVWIDITPS